MACLPCLAIGSAAISGTTAMTSKNFKYYVISLVILLISVCIYAYYSFINKCESCTVKKDKKVTETSKPEPMASITTPSPSPSK